MSKIVAVVMSLSLSSLLLGCPDKGSDSGKPAAATSSTPAAAAPAPASAAPKAGGGGW